MSNNTISRRDFLRQSLAVGAGVVAGTVLAANNASSEEGSTMPEGLKVLNKIYYSQHSGGDFNDVCLVRDPRPRGCDQWPGRTEVGAAAELKFLEKYRQIIREGKEDEGIFFIPTNMKTGNELIALAREHFGDRAVVWNSKSQLLGDDWGARLQADRELAIQRRGPNITASEFGIWGSGKHIATDLLGQLQQQGYTFDPATVEVIVFGGDWYYCAGSYPIHAARAWGLAKGVTRRFDLILKDESPLFMNLELVEQNLPMPENIDLFIFKTPDEGPTWGRYIAQYWERAHGVMDPPHVVTVELPPKSATEINIFGWGPSRAAGTNGQFDLRGPGTVMSVGSGGYVPYPATIIQAEDSLSLEDFRAALLAGTVSEYNEAP